MCCKCFSHWRFGHHLSVHLSTVTYKADTVSHRGIWTAWSTEGAQEPGDLVSMAPWEAAADAGIGWEERVALLQDTAEAEQRECTRLTPLSPPHTCFRRPHMVTGR